MSMIPSQKPGENSYNIQSESLNKTPSNKYKPSEKQSFISQIALKIINFFNAVKSKASDLRKRVKVIFSGEKKFEDRISSVFQDTINGSKTKDVKSEKKAQVPSNLEPKGPSTEEVEKWKEELLAGELSFKQLAKREGLQLVKLISILKEEFNFNEDHWIDFRDTANEAYKNQNTQEDSVKVSEDSVKVSNEELNVSDKEGLKPEEVSKFKTVESSDLEPKGPSTEEVEKWKEELLAGELSFKQLAKDLNTSVSTVIKILKGDSSQDEWSSFTKEVKRVQNNLEISNRVENANVFLSQQRDSVREELPSFSDYVTEKNYKNIFSFSGDEKGLKVLAHMVETLSTIQNFSSCEDFVAQGGKRGLKKEDIDIFFNLFAIKNTNGLNHTLQDLSSKIPFHLFSENKRSIDPVQLDLNSLEPSEGLVIERLTIDQRWAMKDLSELYEKVFLEDKRESLSIEDLQHLAPKEEITALLYLLQVFPNEDGVYSKNIIDHIMMEIKKEMCELQLAKAATNVTPLQIWSGNQFSEGKCDLNSLRSHVFIRGESREEWSLEDLSVFLMVDKEALEDYLKSFGINTENPLQSKDITRAMRDNNQKNLKRTQEKSFRNYIW